MLSLCFEIYRAPTETELHEPQSPTALARLFSQSLPFPSASSTFLHVTMLLGLKWFLGHPIGNRCAVPPPKPIVFYLQTDLSITPEFVS